VVRAVEDAALESEDPGGMPESEAATLYLLMTWLSPAFSGRGLSYSSGIEWDGEAGDVG